MKKPMIIVLIFLCSICLFASEEPEIIDDYFITFKNGVVVDISELSVFYGTLISGNVVQTKFNLIWDEEKARHTNLK